MRGTHRTGDLSRSPGSVVLLVSLYDENSMTPDERMIAVAALSAGPWEDHDQIVIAIAARLKLETQKVEAVLKRLRIRMVLVCVSAANAGSETASVRYQRGVDWTDEE